MSEEPQAFDGSQEEPSDAAPARPRPAFIGPAPVAVAPRPRKERAPRWVIPTVIAALLLGAGLGVGGTLLVSGDGDGDRTVPAAAGPGSEAGSVSTLSLPGAPADDPAAYGTVEISGAPLPRLEGQVDSARGRPMPELAGADFAGNTVAITNDGQAKLILFVAHWCPYCRDEVPVVRDWVDTSEIPDNVDVYSVVTLTDPARGNYPPSSWLEQESWNVPLIVDDTLDSAATAFGLNAVPFWVLVDTDGSIAGRGAGGGVPAETLDSIVLSLSEGPEQ